MCITWKQNPFFFVFFADVETWVRCPLGVCPGQELTPTLLDLPAEVDRAIEGTSPPVDYLQCTYMYVCIKSQYKQCVVADNAMTVGTANRIEFSPKLQHSQ